MSAPSAQRSRRHSARSSASYVDPGMRVSDAERSAVADRLSKHFGDGRLDQAEFDRRLDQAMNAKTRADLDGLLADLPDDEATGSAGVAGPDGAALDRRRGRQRSIALLIITIVIAVIIVHALDGMFFPWLLIAIVAFLWLRHTDSRRRQP